MQAICCEVEERISPTFSTVTAGFGQMETGVREWKAWVGAVQVWT